MQIDLLGERFNFFLIFGHVAAYPPLFVAIHLGVVGTLLQILLRFGEQFGFDIQLILQNLAASFISPFLRIAIYPGKSIGELAERPRWGVGEGGAMVGKGSNNIFLLPLPGVLE